MRKFFKKPSKLWWLGLSGVILANAVYPTKSFIGWFVTLGFFLLVPGYLFLQLVTQEIRNRWEVLSFSLGLSILIMMLGGLTLNSLHAFGLQRPLTTWNIFLMLDAVTLILLALNRKLTINLPCRLPHPSKAQVTIFAALSVLPWLAIGGAIRLNNGASNILTMILFALIAILFIILAWRKNLVSLYPYAIIMMGLSVLFSISLRGWGITGHDIQREYYVFQLTSKADYWNIAAFRNPYNACLSITILPTIIAKITHVSDPYVYKVIFQSVFAVGLLPIYLFAKRLRDERTALFAGLIFISFPTFLNDMPFLNRQEIAFVFFSLLLLTTFLNVTRRTKTVLSVAMLLGLILSHYSSSYVTLGLLILAWIFYKLLNLKNKTDKIPHTLPLLSIPIILTALLFTFLWNSQITTTTAGLKSTLTKSMEGLLDHSGAQSEDVSYSLLAPRTKSPPELLAKYASKDTDQVQYAPQPNLPPTKLGKTVSQVISVTTLNSFVRAFSAKVLQILLLVGVAVLFFRQRKKATKYEKYFLALSCACVALLILQTLLPQLSVDYGTLRFFQQALIVLAIPIIVATDFLAGFLSHAKNYVVVIFFAFLFLDLSGFIPQVLGGYQPSFSLNNQGTVYDVYYVHEAEVVSAYWVLSTIGSRSPISMDQYAQLRFLPYVLQNQIHIVSPLSPPGDAYFYRDYANESKGLYAVDLNDTVFEYTYTPPLNNRNLIYNNESTDVYSPISSR